MDEDTKHIHKKYKGTYLLTTFENPQPTVVLLNESDKTMEL